MTIESAIGMDKPILAIFLTHFCNFLILSKNAVKTEIPRIDVKYVNSPVPLPNKKRTLQETNILTIRLNSA